MNIDFRDVMSKKSNEELATILKLHKNDYQPEAIECAEAEFKSRNLSLDNFIIYKESGANKTETIKNQTNNPYNDIIRPFLGIFALLLLGFFMVKDPYLMENVELEGRKVFYKGILKAIWGLPVGIIALSSGTYLLYRQIQKLRKRTK